MISVDRYTCQNIDVLGDSQGVEKGETVRYATVRFQ